MGATLDKWIGASQWLDDLTVGRRKLVLLSGALLVAASQFGVWFLGLPAVVEILLTALLLTVLVAYTTARAVAFIDDWENFKVGHALRSVWAYVKIVTSRDDVEDGDVDPDQASIEVEQKKVSRLLKFALSFVALRSVVALLLFPFQLYEGWQQSDEPPAPTESDEKTLSTLDEIENGSLLAALLGWGLLGVGGITWARLWLEARGRKPAQPADALGPADAQLALSDGSALPPAIDLVRRKSEAEAYAARVRDPVLRKLITTLPRWRPGQRRYESEYHALLERFLKRHFKGHNINSKASVKVFKGGKRRRVPDFIIDDTIVIELKPRLHTAGPTHVAVGQVGEYATIFAERGPVFLLVCETDADFENSYLATAFLDRRINRPTVIAAGPARSR